MYFQAHTFEVNSCFRSTINGSINKVWNFRINLNQISLSERYPTKIGNRKVCVVLILDEIERETETETEIEIETEALINNNQVFDTTAHESESQQKLLCIAPSRAVPVMVATADVLSGLAAGMSIRYFPIFFLENLKMSPTDVQITFIASMMCMAGMTKVVQKIGIKIGRLQITIICKWIGALLLLSMIQAYKSGQSAMTICTLYVLRTSFMNSCASLTKSVLMDHVPKEERAKWSSLESVNSFSWAGSAAVGGFLVDVEGILFNFSITTVLQLVATIPLILVFGRARSEN